MKKLTEEEFEKFVDEFNIKFGEFICKTIQYEHFYTDVKLFNNKLKTLEAEYTGYTDPSLREEWTPVTEKYISELKSNEDPSAIFIEDKYKWLGKTIKCGGNFGKFVDIARTLDDYYWLIQQSDDEIIWCSSISKLELIKN